MKICWDNINNIRYNPSKDRWYHLSHGSWYIYIESCSVCGEPFLSQKGKNTICSFKCKDSTIIGENNPMKDKNVRNKHEKIVTSQKYRTRHSILSSGKNNGNWKGGISNEPYCPVFNLKEWREMIYDRDKDKFCWNPQCEGRGTKESLHHIDYDKKNCHPSNIIKICNSCNSKANGNREWWSSFYRIVMDRRNL